MVEYENQVKGVYVSKGSVYVSKEMSFYHYPFLISDSQIRPMTIM